MYWKGNFHGFCDAMKQNDNIVKTYEVIGYSLSDRYLFLLNFNHSVVGGIRVEKIFIHGYLAIVIKQ